MLPFPLLLPPKKGSSRSRRRREESVDGGERGDGGERFVVATGSGDVPPGSADILE